MDTSEELASVGSSHSDDLITDTNFEEIELDDTTTLRSRIAHPSQLVSNLFIETPGVPPELTVRAIILGCILCVVLSSANIYVGLKVGLTVSASIPAAVLSAAILAWFKDHCVLENNQVQTAASAGEALAAGVIFTIPTLVMIGHWDNFHYWQVTCISALGGILGVLFTVPLRRTLIVPGKLPFPEGVATAAVLESVSPTSLDPQARTKAGGAKGLGVGIILGGIVKLAEAGFQVWGAALSVVPKWGGLAMLDVSPALLGVGYVVGLPITCLISAGGVFSWWIALPVYYHWVYSPQSAVFELEAIDLNASELPLATLLDALWHEKIRMIGVGAMLVGGFWVVLSIYAALWAGVKSCITGLVSSKRELEKQAPRAEQDIHGTWLIFGSFVCVIGLGVLYFFILGSIAVTSAVTLTMVLFGFIGSAAAGYMAGLVGSSNNPVSGIAVSTVMFSSFVVLAVSQVHTDFTAGAAGAVLVSSVVCCASAIAGDNLQDLKAGHLLGATPWKQQLMQIMGVVLSACVASPVLQVLKDAYGFRCHTSRGGGGYDYDDYDDVSPSMSSTAAATKFNPLAAPSTGLTSGAHDHHSHNRLLAAPQACLIEHLAKGVFERNLSWELIGFGAAIAVFIIIVDKILQVCKSKYRVHILAVAVGMYLPFELIPPMVLGGAIGSLSKYIQHNEWSEHGGLLCASGLITGEAVMGIVIAIFGATVGPDFLALVDKPLGAGPWLAVISLVVCGYALLYNAVAGSPHLGRSKVFFPVWFQRRAAPPPASQVMVL